MKIVRLVMILISALLIGQSSISGQQLAGTPEAEERTVPQFFLAPHDGQPGDFFHDVEAQPGATIELKANAVNAGEIEVELDVFKINANVSIGGGFSPGKPDDSPVGLTTWLSVPEQTFTLQPGESHEISFSITVPDDVAAGQYISGLMVRTSEPLPIPGTGTLNQMLAHVMSVSILVPGEIVHAFEIGEPDIRSAENARTLSVQISNTGNYRVKPAGILSIAGSDGVQVAEVPIEMGSVYAGMNTDISVDLPQQMAPGNYTVELTLVDEESGFSASMDESTVAVSETDEDAVMLLMEQTVTPNSEDVVFVDVDLNINNRGDALPAASIVLNVYRDGEIVDEYSPAANQLLSGGENLISIRYVPSSGTWEPGTYTFHISVNAVDPDGGLQIELLTEELDVEIVVP